MSESVALWSKVILTVVPFLAAPALADEGGPLPIEEGPHRGALLVEVQPPALDGSLYGVRLEIAPSRELPWSFGLMARTGGWSQSVGAKARFTGANAGDVKLNYALGAEGRYTLATLGNNTLRPFVGLTVGAEEFHVRLGDGDLGSYTTSVFFEPAVGAMWTPGTGRVGLSARVGPGFSTTDVRELQVGASEMKLRPVYPTASLSLLVVL